MQMLNTSTGSISTFQRHLHRCAIAVLSALPLALGGCGDSGTAAIGEVTVTAVVTALPDPYIVGEQTITLSRAHLFLESIEVLGGEAIAEHSHDEEHSHDDEHSHDEHGGSEIVLTDIALDLLAGEEVVLDTLPNAPAGEYTLVAISLAPAEGGPSDGITLHIAGEVSKGTETRSFEIRWVAEEFDFWMNTNADIELRPGEAVELLIQFEVEKLLAGVDFFAASADTNGHVDIDAATNSDLLPTLRSNLSSAITWSHSSHDHHDHDA